MIQRIVIWIFNLFLGSLFVAAGHITNQNFNEMIENTTLQQRKTASAVVEQASQESRVRDSLLERPQSHGLRY